jgi:hypothetical protein
MGNSEDYEKALRDALDNISVVAVRYAVDTRRLVIELDANRAPGPHKEHTLTISVRGAHLAVSKDKIPHDWLSIGTGFIDPRLSRIAGSLLIELEKKARQAGVDI